MTRDDAKIGTMFFCNNRLWKVTDIGTRVVVALPLKEGWMNGPPYPQAEIVFDEDDLPACELIP